MNFTSISWPAGSKFLGFELPFWPLHTVRKFNRWRCCLSCCDEISTLCLTKLYVTYSFASSVTYSVIRQNLSYSVVSTPVFFYSISHWFCLSSSLCVASAIFSLQLTHTVPKLTRIFANRSCHGWTAGCNGIHVSQLQYFRAWHRNHIDPVSNRYRVGFNAEAKIMLGQCTIFSRRNITFPAKCTEFFPFVSKTTSISITIRPIVSLFL